MSSPPPTSAADALGPDALELIRLVEGDLERHAAAIDEHQRTALTIRGLALTAVAGLEAGSYASFVALPDYFAVAAALVFLSADYYYSRLYTGVERRIPVLESLSSDYRRLLGRPARSRNALDDLRGDLRAYSAAPVAPDARPDLWPVQSLGRLKVFIPFYIALALSAGISAWFVSTHEKPGSRTPPTIVCVGSAVGVSPPPASGPSVEVVPCNDVPGLTRMP
jgi:hypothetical protein